MRGEKILKILSCLENMAQNYTDLFEVFCSTYPLTIGEIERKMKKKSQKRNYYFENLLWDLKEKEKLSKLIHKLKEQGLISKTEDKKFILTEKGREKLSSLKEKFKQQVNFNKETQESERELIILIYDVPEYEKKKRDTLRRILTSYKFELLQKSVWLKKGSVSENFINFLKDIDVLDYVHLFKINQTGTIEKI
jgi:DNA-binding transcriptional regulator PaaX